MANAEIDKLFGFIISTAESIKILAETDPPIIKEILYGNEPLVEGCPSRASAAEFQLRGLKGRVDEMTELLTSLEREIFAHYSDKK